MKPTEVTVTIETINKEKALKILEGNRDNRRVIERHVRYLARSMSLGKWQFNAETIKIAADGELLDGQHRLLAVVLSGVPIKTLVARGVARDVYLSINDSKVGTHGEVVRRQGHTNSRRIASALMLIDRYKTGRAHNKVEYPKNEMQDLLKKYPGVPDVVKPCLKFNGLLTPAILDCCSYLFQEKDPAAAQEFIEKCMRGIGIQPGNPWYALRQKLEQNRESKAKLSDAQILALCITAWNHFRENKTVSHLRLKKEVGGRIVDFPEVI